jgi:hypothetical protein
MVGRLAGPYACGDGAQQNAESEPGRETNDARVRSGADTPTSES